ncbi:MAG: hypothetical protein SF187_24980 [Deltaproteobacteria bacterium]|nr:hypothetical protein [Deltaproteobacteria bacterium]
MRAFAVVLAAVASASLGVGSARAQSEFEAPQRYGDAGTNHVGVSLGLGSGNGLVWAAGAEYGHFIMDGVAPTAEVSVSGGSQVLTVARTMAALRLLPWRSGSVWPLLVPRAGRLFIENNPDLWGAGGTVGVIVGLSGRVALQVSYEYLRLFPRGDCTTLSTGCSLQRWGLGFVLGF